MGIKTIVLGIDGGDLEILRRLHLPTFDKVFNEGIAHDLTTERFIRGWPTILTGETAEAHKGLYGVLEMKGYLFNDSFSTKNYEENPTLKPLWKEVNQRGFSVGFLNVPTTFPAPEVNGFMVSGGGGNQSLTWPEMGYPERIKEHLEEAGGYISDVRVAPGEYRSFTKLLSDLSEMVRRRSQQFAHLLERYQPDLGFVCFVGPDRIEHALYKNLEAMMDDAQTSPPLEKEILDYYHQLDSVVAELMERFEGATFVFISDHGMAPYHRNFHLNVVLEQGGFIRSRKESSTSWRETVKKVVRDTLPKNVRRWVKDTAPGLSSSLAASEYKIAESIAFSIIYVNGVFVNEVGRFPQGKVAPQDYDKVVKDIIDLCEGVSTPECPIKARTYRSLYRGSFYEQYLPDVVLDYPKDTYIQHTAAPSYLIDNPEYKLYDDDLPGHLYSVISGIHRSECLFAAVGPRVTEAAAVFNQRTLKEFYHFLLRLCE